jgi:hypothetical protein
MFDQPTIAFFVAYSILFCLVHVSLPLVSTRLSTLIHTNGTRFSRPSLLLHPNRTTTKLVLKAKAKESKTRSRSRSKREQTRHPRAQPPTRTQQPAILQPERPGYLRHYHQWQTPQTRWLKRPWKHPRKLRTKRRPSLRPPPSRWQSKRLIRWRQRKRRRRLSWSCCWRGRLWRRCSRRCLFALRWGGGGLWLLFC